MRFILVTGMSGAGKSLAIRTLEDLGYYCVDNILPVLIPKFAELCYASKGNLTKVAIVCDIRSGENFQELFNSLDEIENKGFKYEILFLDCNNETLIKRYKETRRTHPLGKELNINDAITKERKLLSMLNAKANSVVNTSYTNHKELSDKIYELYGDDEKEGLMINVLSFGFKYGIPIDADLVFDVRFLPNPYYVEELKNHTGLEKEVFDYVMQFEDTKVFVSKLIDMLEFLIPKYDEEGKKRLVIAIGCTGGRHRSVTITEEVYNRLKGKYNVIKRHRDYKKDEY